MKQTILIHGLPDPEEIEAGIVVSESHWFPWLKQNIETLGQSCATPEFSFQNGEPYYLDWVALFERHNPKERDVLVGHSLGGGFLIRYLSEHPELKPAKTILVAPWIDPDHDLTTDFFNFEMDSGLGNRIDLHVFISSDDDAEMQKTFETIKEKIPNIKIHQFTNRGHFCTKEFPEILELLTHPA